MILGISNSLDIVHHKLQPHLSLLPRIKFLPQWRVKPAFYHGINRFRMRSIAEGMLNACNILLTIPEDRFRAKKVYYTIPQPRYL